MIFRKLAILSLSAATVSALLSCNAPLKPSRADLGPAETGSARVDLQAIYSEMGRTGGRIFALAPQDSVVRIYVFRAGRAARLGHNHVLSAPEFTGFFHLPPNGAASGRFDLLFRLDQLAIDDPAYRFGLGPAFSSVLSSDDIEGTKEHLLGADGLQADRFPFVSIRSLEISGEAPKFAARIEVDLHGQEREMWVPLEVQGLPDRISVSGSFVLSQTDFGLRPYSLLAGLLSVRNEVVLDFKLSGTCLPDLSRKC
jgi:hypothetical protein